MRARFGSLAGSALSKLRSPAGCHCRPRCPEPRSGLEPGGGSIFRVHMKDRVPHDYREAFLAPEEQRRLKLLLDHLFDSGFMMINTCSAAMSTTMGTDEIDALIGAMAEGFKKIR